MTARLRVGLVWVAVVVVALGALRMWAVAADPPKLADDRNPPLFAVAACSACHNGDEKHPYKKYGSHEFILLNEGPTWDKFDPHQNSFAVLEREPGLKIGKALGYGDDPKQWTACLTCHAVDKFAHADRLHPDAAMKSATERFATAGGVGCVACHGVGKEWQSAHYREPDELKGTPPWREKSVDDKTKAGQRDLRDPTVRANLCASCHVGSAALKRVVTHDMYAAGHPPLPPFELATFQNGEPPHWAQPSQLKYFQSLPAAERLAKFHQRADEVTAARDVATGAIAAARAEAEMLRADAERVLNDKPGGDAIDFARFDCAACHHDLKFPSDRQNRPVAEGPPGRPPLRASVRYLAEVVATHAAECGPGGPNANEFNDKWTALRKAATDRPFGDPAKVAKAADDVEKWCTDYLNSQSKAPATLYTPQAAANLRERIGTAAKGPAAADPEAAMVLAWAYFALGDKPLPAGAVADYDKVLPFWVRPPGTRAKDEASIGFAERQRKANAYRADAFRKAFDALRPPK